MTINLSRARRSLQEFNFRELFIEELGWSNPVSSKIISAIDGAKATPIAQLSGVMILQVTSQNGEIPNAQTRKAIHKEISGLYLENLLIFVDRELTKSLWYWAKRESNKLYYREQLFTKGQTGDLLLSKLGALVIDFAELEKGDLSVVQVARRLQDSFDIEKVTKKFYKDFQEQHGKFLEFVEGIDHEGDRRWYTSVILNRLMFIYFLQRKYFLDRGDEFYLQRKLEQSKQQGENLFYSEFLEALFFQGFAKPERERSPHTNQLIGKIKYLNGELFIKHHIENTYPHIRICDRAFEEVLNLFSRYSWNLDDSPSGNDEEINPDVLGYIFEKYINQKAFGAYYTCPEITEYLCDRTINKLICDRLTSPSPLAITGRGVRGEGLTELLLKLDADQCDRLLNEILPNLSLLDPACGSGAFLVAAMKTLIEIYTTVASQAKQFTTEKKIANWLTESQKSSSLDYYIKKRIITDNLYGVDIMEEATEIAKLRLFLALVASAKKIEDLEPLPNIDFNIMAGNSLIGLIRVDAEGFDRISQTSKSKGMAVDPTQKNLFKPTILQGNILQAEAYNNYQAILEDKNKSITLYKKHAFLKAEQQEISQDDRLLQLRDHIDKLNRDSQVKLNQLLLDEFSTKLGIKYEEAQLTGKPKKRVLNINDINALEPFHWGYHFDQVINNRGGFDAIITNPPWEIFKPQAKEFFAVHSDLVTKNKMDIKAFEKEQAKLLENPEVATAWLNYQSQYPHVSAYFRSALDYSNQISVVNGKKAGTDINLYKLFLERCFNLLRPSGECGIVIPSGIYTDLGTKQLREMLFTQTNITGLFCFENRKEIFEGVHRSFKFIILTFEKGGKTESFPTRFMRHYVAELAIFPNPDDIRLDVPLIRKLSPDSLSIMEFKDDIDIQIAKKMLQFPFLGEWIDGEPLQFSREFMSTDDHHRFNYVNDGLIVCEGKMFEQFNSSFDKPQWWMSLQELQKTHFYDRGDWKYYRFAIRRIASNTNERTLIASILPKNNVVVHSVFVNVKNILPIDSSLCLVSFLNSFIADFTLRSKVSSNVSQFFIHQLPVPRLQKGDKWFDQIVERAAQLICTTPEFDDLAQEIGLKPLSPTQKYPEDEKSKYGAINEVHRAKLRAELDGIIAHIYGLTETEFAHILTTFPIVADPIKQNALNAFRDVERGLLK